MEADEQARHTITGALGTATHQSVKLAHFATPKRFGVGECTVIGCALAATKTKLGVILTLDKNHRIFRLERLPGGTCTHWKSAALSRRTPTPAIGALQNSRLE